MKTLFYTITFVTLVAFAKAQSYLPIPFDTTHYWIETISSLSPPQCGAYVQLKVKYNKTFNGKVYHKIGEFGSVTTTSSTNNCYLNTQIKGYVRQDSLLKKVWVLTDTVNFNEILLYDFSLNVGDTAKYLCPGCINYPIVSAITTTLLGDGISHKVMSHTVVAGFNPIYCDLIEGVGSSVGFFETSHNSPYSRKLDCFGKIITYPNNFQTVYTGFGGTCSINTDIRKFNQSALLNFDVHPNPATEIINLNFSEIESGVIYFYNDSGNLELELKFDKQKVIKIDTDKYSEGIYLLKIKTERGYMNKKILVTK